MMLFDVLPLKQGFDYRKIHPCLWLGVEGDVEPYNPPADGDRDLDLYQTSQQTRKHCVGKVVPVENESHTAPPGTIRLAAVWRKKLLEHRRRGSAKMGGMPGQLHFFQVDLWYEGETEIDLFVQVCGDMFELTPLGTRSALWEDGDINWPNPILTTNRALDMGKPIHLFLSTAPPHLFHNGRVRSGRNIGTQALWTRHRQAFCHCTTAMVDTRRESFLPYRPTNFGFPFVQPFPELYLYRNCTNIARWPI